MPESLKLRALFPHWQPGAEDGAPSEQGRSHCHSSGEGPLSLVPPVCRFTSDSMGQSNSASLPPPWAPSQPARSPPQSPPNNALPQPCPWKGTSLDTPLGAVSWNKAPLLDLLLHHCDLCSVFTGLSPPCVCVPVSLYKFPLLIRTPVTGFRAHPNPV